MLGFNPVTEGVCVTIHGESAYQNGSGLNADVE